MLNKLRRFFIGKTLKSEEIAGEKLNVFWGLPVLSSDAISSVAYAGQEILYVLVPVIGVMAYKNMFYIALAIIALLFILVFSYRQTIDSYPCGGGSYIVATDNLGTLPGLIAGASLSVDYILTVAVSICAGTAAITSAVPALLNYRIIISLALILLLTIGNLRGIKESSRLFGFPTYLFIISAIILIIIGLYKIYVLRYTPTQMQTIPKAAGEITTFLILRAFAGGCTALTGVEAVSNGIPNFKEPAQENAKKVLALLALVTLIIFGGTSFLATLYHAVPNSRVTVLAQIAMQVFGANSIMFYILQITTAIILVMASNTSFSDFPLLFSLIARDGYAPKQFYKRGIRLTFSNGICMLGIAASILVIIFGGDSHLLLPLYAVGVFASFTLSQTGMFTKWIRKKNPGWKHKAFINGFGAIITFITVLIIGISKFTSGAWFVLILIPAITLLMLRIKMHYNAVARQLSLTTDELPGDVEIKHIIVPIDNLNKASIKALKCAKYLSNDVIAFHISLNSDEAALLSKKWKSYNIQVPLVIKYSPYRDVVEPLIKYIESEEHSSKPGDLVTVVMPQFIVKNWWQNVLHNQTANMLRRKLLRYKNIAVITIPYVLKH